MTCLNCGHGPSWHEESFLNYRNGWDEPWWEKRKIPCTHPDCQSKTLEFPPKCIKFKGSETWLREGHDDNYEFPQEQVERLRKLKEEQKPQIVVDKDFHELFCRVMKEELDKDCNCFGTTSEIRKK